MKKKFFVTFLILSFFIIDIGFCKNVDLPEIDAAKSIENEKNLLLYSDANWKNFFTSGTEIVLTNLFVYDFCTIILDQSWIKPTPKSMWNNLTSPWLWDTSSFLKNQIAHPYFGNMYFTSARSNGLNFWQSFLMTAAGSFLWENCIESGNNSLNDFITTTFAGAAIGEVLFRLGNEAARIHPLLGALFNPVGGINSILTGRKLGSEKSNIYAMNFDLGFSFAMEDISFGQENNQNKKSRMLPELNLAANVVYGNPYGHHTKEFMDQFQLSFDGNFFTNSYFIKMNFDSEFYSFPLNTFPNVDSNIGISFDYDFLVSDSDHLSKNSLGAFYKFKYEVEKYLIAFGAQTDFIFFGVTDNIFTDYEGLLDKGKTTYTFGPKTKIFFEYSSPLAGQFYVDGEMDFLFSYGDTFAGKKMSGDFLVLSSEASYKHSIFKNFFGGIKMDFYKKIRLDSNNEIFDRGFFSSSIFLEYNLLNK